MSVDEVNVTDALMTWEWLCRQDTNGRRYWVHTFLEDRDDKSTAQNLIPGLNSDAENFWRFARTCSNEEKKTTDYRKRNSLLQVNYKNARFIKEKY
jgi:hypothetical protein